MTWWPGWDSITNTGWWSHFWFWFGIACLFALGASEIVSHVYSLRKDELVAAAETAATTQRNADADAAEKRRKAEVGGLQQQLGEAEKKVTALETQNKSRKISPDDKKALTADLSHSPGQQVRIFCVTNAWDAAEYAKDFKEVFEAAKWVFVGEPIAFGITPGHDTVGIELHVNPRVIAEPQAVPEDFGDSINYLVRALVRFGQMPQPTLTQNPAIPYGQIEVRIGRIPFKT